jgi:hypothetical protein
LVRCGSTVARVGLTRVRRVMHVRGSC